jgi:hypothetical protein
MRPLAAAVLALLCASCSSSSGSGGVPPVVDAVDASDTVKAGQQLAMTVKGHDDDDNILTVKVHLVASLATQDPPPAGVPQPGKQISAAFALVFVGAPAGAVIEYDVTLVDATNKESAPFKKTVTVQ